MNLDRGWILWFISLEIPASFIFKLLSKGCKLETSEIIVLKIAEVFECLDMGVDFQSPPGLRLLRGAQRVEALSSASGTFIALHRLEKCGYRAYRICTNANESQWHDGTVTFLHRNYR